MGVAGFIRTLSPFNRVLEYALTHVGQSPGVSPPSDPPNGPQASAPSASIGSSAQCVLFLLELAASSHQLKKKLAEGDMRAKKSKDDHRTRKVSSPSADKKKPGGFRHTIQVEYDDAQPSEGQQQSPARRGSSKRREMVDTQQMEDRATTGSREHISPTNTSPTRERTRSSRRPSQSNPAKPLPVPPPTLSQQDASVTTPTSAIQVSTSTTTVVENLQNQESAGSHSSKQGKHRKGLSMDRMGLGKIFGTTPMNEVPNGIGSRLPSERSDPTSPTLEEGNKRPEMQTLHGHLTPKSSFKNHLLNPDEQKNSRRNTLTAMVEPFKTRRYRSKATSSDTPSKERISEKLQKPQPPAAVKPAPPEEKNGALPVDNPPFSNASNSDFPIGPGMSASTSKARKVMQWFRTKNKGQGLSDIDEFSLRLDGQQGDPTLTQTQAQFSRPAAAASTNTIQTLPTGQTGPVQLYVTQSEQPGLLILNGRRRPAPNHHWRRSVSPRVSADPSVSHRRHRRVSFESTTVRSTLTRSRLGRRRR